MNNKDEQNQNMAESDSQPSGSHRRTYEVEGMTCDHCKMAVTKELDLIKGIDTIEVDVPGGRVTVSGDVSEEDVSAAIEEAGFRVTA